MAPRRKTAGGAQSFCSILLNRFAEGMAASKTSHRWTRARALRRQNPRAAFVLSSLSRRNTRQSTAGPIPAGLRGGSSISRSHASPLHAGPRVIQPGYSHAVSCSSPLCESAAPRELWRSLCKMVRPTRTEETLIRPSSRCNSNRSSSARHRKVKKISGKETALSSYISSRLEKFFKDPLKFDPDRFHPDAPKPYYCYYPFALGPRSCIGQNFAQIEIKVVIAKLIQRFDFTLVPGQSFDIKETGTLTPKSGVLCKIKHRHTS
ncbi:hypothetical protein WMY93_015738 [Mugilogobius chulae]|uniref:Uncharacterized protein n=1 Tax=Mugilogobius chulae TaxID=88201 RepID=A0AAW0P1C2_9GOBI